MRSASVALINFLNSNTQFLMADLYTITLVNGFVAYYTNSDTQLIVNGHVYAPAMIKRGPTKVSVGLEVDTLEVDFYEAPTDLLNGTQWLAAARNGALDGATLSLDRLFMSSFGDSSLGTVNLFTGQISDIELGRTHAHLTVKSQLELLDVQMPRRMYSSGCSNTLFDFTCNLSKPGFAVNGTVTSGSSVTQINSALGQAAGYFALGTITFNTGANAGVTRSVRGFSGGAFTLSLPLVNAPGVGDAFTAYPGCDKTKATCASKFNNLPNFYGFPFVPDPETAI